MREAEDALSRLPAGKLCSAPVYLSGSLGGNDRGRLPARLMDEPNPPCRRDRCGDLSGKL